MSDIGLKASLLREIRQLTSRRIYLVSMVLVPVLMLVFFSTLFGEGLPLKVPSAVVDLDHSKMSREVTRNLNSVELISVTHKCESYAEALEEIRKGEIMAFFVIPDKFEHDVLAGKSPVLEYYTNMTYFVPATLSFKGFKTVAVTTAGGVVSVALSSVGVNPHTVSSMVQPVVFDAHGLGNPWTNYNYYLSPSFMAGLLALMVLLLTSYSITSEIKNGTSVQWLAVAKNRMSVALAGKLIPQNIIFTIVGLLMISGFWKWLHFPNNGNLWWLILAMWLMVTACQAFALLISSALPNPRLSLSVCSLLGILSFSFTGFSFPIENMYGWIAIFGYMMPVRWYFMIYGKCILNGFDVYYSRLYFVALLIYPLVGWLLCGRLKKACLNPVYVP